MSKKRNIKKSLILTTLFSFIFPTTLMLTSCKFNYPKVFSIGTSNDLFESSKTPLGATFIDAPTTTNFNSVYGRLTNYFTNGDWEFNTSENGSEPTLKSQPTSNLRMELANKIVIYYQDTPTTPVLENANTEKQFVIDLNNGNNGFINGTKYFDSNTIGQYLVKANKVEFHLNTNFSWLDKNGQEKQKLNPKDFLYGLKAYKYSIDLGFNRNGYFLDLSGIDYQKTIDYNTDDKMKNNTFTYVIGNTKSPYLLDILSKQYFFPMPHTHPEAILTLPENNENDKGPIKKNKNGTIDANATNWSKVYGGDQVNDLDVWFLGPYYISSISLQDVVFQKNKNYFEQLKDEYKDSSKKLDKVILKYKAGSPEVMYNRFKSGEFSYVNVPAAQAQDAIRNFYDQKNPNNSALIPMPAPKTSQGTYISYNMQIYNDNHLKELVDGNQTATKNWEKFIKKFHTADGLNIRKGINQVINWARLAEAKYGIGLKDFYLSSIPYGVYDPVNNATSTDNQTPGTKEEFYNQIAKDNSKFPGIIGGRYNKMKSSSELWFDDNNGDEQDKSIRQTMIKSLTNLGFSNTNPLTMEFWTLSQTNDPTDLAYYQQLEKAISNVTNNIIQFKYVPFNSRSLQKVYYSKSATSGSMLWGPDYNGLGTWVGIFFSYEFDKNGDPKVMVNVDNQQEEGFDNLKPSYHLANLWLSLYKELNKTTTNSDSATKTWQQSLKEHLITKKAAEFGEGKTFRNIKSNLDTEISIWAGINDSNGVNLVNWIDSQYPVFPMFAPSLNYQSYKLVDPKYEVVLNLNGEMSYKDFNRK